MKADYQGSYFDAERAQQEINRSNGNEDEMEMDLGNGQKIIVTPDIKAYEAPPPPSRMNKEKKEEFKQKMKSIFPQSDLSVLIPQEDDEEFDDIEFGEKKP